MKSVFLVISYSSNPILGIGKKPYEFSIGAVEEVQMGNG